MTVFFCGNTAFHKKTVIASAAKQSIAAVNRNAAWIATGFALAMTVFFCGNTAFNKKIVLASVARQSISAVNRLKCDHETALRLHPK